MKLAIKGIGIAGAFGSGTDALAAALSSGRCEPGRATVKTPHGPVDIPAYLTDTAKLEEFVNKRALRRVDHFSKMALLGSHLALKDASMMDSDKERIGIILATGYGAARTTFEFLGSFILAGDNLSSPTSFSSSVHNAAVASVSMILGITGPGLTVTQFEMSVASALLAARAWLEEGRVDHVLFGSVDEYFDVLGYCWEQSYGEKAIVPREMKPLAFDEQTAIPGEGAAFFVLGREDDAPQYGFIEDVAAGRFGTGMLDIPDDRRVFLAADGNRIFGASYRDRLPSTARISCYTPLYGSFPTGQAFDMAIAALSRKEGKVFPSSGAHFHDSPGEELGNDKVQCLLIGREDQIGSIVLS